MAFNEDSRVKIPALIHLTRLGYKYLSRKQHNQRNEDTNIFPGIFSEAIQRVNPTVPITDIERHLQEISLKLDYDDLDREFFKALTATSGIKLIDFKNFQNNSFHVTTELTCKNGEDEFRPDITVLTGVMGAENSKDLQTSHN
jgi:type I restriction enzyme R subunit